jgi:adenylylsulfate kinase-like enzyme
MESTSKETGSKGGHLLDGDGKSTPLKSHLGLSKNQRYSNYRQVMSIVVAKECTDGWRSPRGSGELSS